MPDQCTCQSHSPSNLHSRTNSTVFECFSLWTSESPKWVVPEEWQMVMRPKANSSFPTWKGFLYFYSLICQNRIFKQFSFFFLTSVYAYIFFLLLSPHMECHGVSCCARVSDRSSEFVVYTNSCLGYECCTAVEDGDMTSVFIYISSEDNNKVMVMG